MERPHAGRVRPASLPRTETALAWLLCLAGLLGLRPAAAHADGAPLVTVHSQRVDGSGHLTLDLEVLAPVPGASVQVQPLVNGRSVRDFTLAASRNLAVSDEYMLTLPVPRGEAEVTVLVSVGGQESRPLRLRVRGQGATLDTRPSLYVLAVGVGQYRDPEVPTLRYAAKDAQDLLGTLKGQNDTVYRDVHGRLLTERDATRGRILDGLSWLRETTGPDDTALLFLAGHGTNDADGSYFFLPHDATADRASMIAGSDLQATLRGIRGKTVLLIDTCHSGNVMWRRSLTRLINELVTENRLVVLAASTGDQLSRESKAWGNGAFTKALIEGLRGAADYVEDRRIMLSELETWTGVRVKELTQGSQTPTLAKPNAAPDYVLAALPRRNVMLSPHQAQRRHILFATLGATLGAAIIAGVIGARPWQGGTPTVDLAFQATQK